jgi:hypothetical protein
MDDEEDLRIMGWKPAPAKRASAIPHQSPSKKRKSHRPLPPVNIQFHLVSCFVYTHKFVLTSVLQVGDDIVDVVLPTTKRGICLGTHTAILRDEGILKAPVVWILSPTDKDVNSIWVQHKWSRSIPITENPLVIKTYKSTITAFDRAL